MDNWKKYEFCMDNVNEYEGFDKPVIIYLNMTNNIVPKKLIFDVEDDNQEYILENLSINIDKITEEEIFDYDNGDYILENSNHLQLKHHYFSFDSLKQKLRNIVFPSFRIKPEFEIITTDNIIFKKLTFDIENERKTFRIVDLWVSENN